MAGTGNVDLWISSSAADSDVQVTLTEVRADGTERYVQNGWLRLSHRKLDPARSTLLNPFHSDEVADMQPLTPGELTEAQIPLFPFAHQFRAGSRIRLTIEAPGGDRPEWAFDTPATNGQVVNRVARDATHLSRLVLPVLPSGPDLGAAAGAVPVAAGPAVPHLRRARRRRDRHLLDSAAVSKADKRERQKENRERAREERERLQKRDRQMKTFRSLLIVLVPIMVILIVVSLTSGSDDARARRSTRRSLHGDDRHERGQHHPRARPEDAEGHRQRS